MVSKWKQDLLFVINKPIRINNEVRFIKNGKLHNIEFPVKIKYYPNDNVEYYSYHFEGKLHRVDGPTQIWYYSGGDGTIRRQKYYYEGKIHRIDGPAETWYYSGWYYYMPRLLL